MQIIELYIKGYKRIEGSVSSLATNKLIDTTAQFTIFAEVGDIVKNLSTNLTASITAIDSDTQVTLNDNIFSSGFPQYLLTSDYFRADLFKDESVSITDSILNVKDISKVFTPFSQQFNLPASKTNNKLFRHYENQDVLNSFDARFRHDAIIKLNGIDYKKGKIQFKNVDLKNNKAYSYKIVFFGDTVELKEVLGDTKLSGLIYPSSLNFAYNYTNITSKFQANPETNDIIVPNIHHTKNMRLNDENLYQDYETGDYLRWTDVKPAIKCSAIIEAINNTYPQINITGYLNSTAFQPLFMWMHKNEGYISNAEEGGAVQIVRNRFRSRFDDPIGYILDPSFPFPQSDIRTVMVQAPATINRVLIYLNFTVPVSTQEYTVRIRRGWDESIIFTEDLTGSQIRNIYLNVNNYAAGALDIIIEIEAENTIGITHNLQVATQIKAFDPFNPTWTTLDTASYVPATAADEAPSNTFIIAQQMPEMKVIDFLSGLFKMFNLVVYKLGNDIVTERAPFWSNIGVAFDITKYVDMEKSTVERLFQYKEMEFKFKSKKSFLVQFSDEIQGTPFSEEIYPSNGVSQFDGGVYKLELPFEKMMYERLTNNSTGNISYIQQGAMLNKKFEPTIGAPLLFCPELQANTNSEMFMIDVSTLIGTLTPFFYNKPTNLFPLPPFGAPQGRSSLNFGIEADEWTGEIPGTSNLFSDGYLDYTESVFNINARLLKVSAYLPLSVITKYQMNDTFVINNKPYRINSVKTNLLTNKTDLELYNKREYVSQIENSEVAFLGRLTSVDITSTASTITISYTPLGDPVANDIDGYSIYVNGSQAFNLPADVSGTTLFSLQSKTSYSIEVKVRYIRNSITAYSFGVGETITTL